MEQSFRVLNKLNQIMKDSFNSKPGMIASWLAIALFAVIASGVGIYNFGNYKMAENEIRALKGEMEELSANHAETQDELTIVSEKLRLKVAETKAKATELEKLKKKRKILSFKGDKSKAENEKQ
jgi:uncharacterized membrane protein